MAKTYKRKREQRRPEERDEREQTRLEKREEGRGRRIRTHRNDVSPSRSAIFPDHEPVGSEEDFNEQTYVGSSTSGASDGGNQTALSNNVLDQIPLQHVPRLHCMAKSSSLFFALSTARQQ
ncbi:uncharacterized protein EV420DRAFT_1650412 [Desarmillaria tabescens]|uniref:Uncharacterized protein n=1 Tax=Armillaria tabescens TaxID=1929756 RepID=A0AA39JD99_ARMTA|nr:uncharacterized protein EV420DRAFT_1650412 [Desarmillaria tabescens]KAK0440662.1 hypothetical protein EV420DRAFT_1650412 [Desarmillaria tabescens]